MYPLRRYLGQLPDRISTWDFPDCTSINVILKSRPPRLTPSSSFPPGRYSSQVYGPGSDSLTGFRVPPPSGTISSSPTLFKAMVPLSPHVAAASVLARSQIVTGRPPASGTFFSLLSAENPIHFPSGEKNGWLAPSVPANGVSSMLSRRRV